MRGPLGMPRRGLSTSASGIWQLGQRDNQGQRSEPPDVRERPGNPIIQRGSEDRTATAGIRRRAVVEIRRRFASAEADVLAAFDLIPVYAQNDVRSEAVMYGLTPEQLAGIAVELAATLARWIAEGRDPAHVFWWDAYEDEAIKLGTAQSVANLTGLSATYAAARTLQQVIYSEPYRRRAGIAKFRAREHWTGLAAEQRTTLGQVIGRAVADGKNPRVVRKEIQEALGVGKARAMLYAQTEIPGVLREARWEEADIAREELGIRSALLWTSALKPTTRSWHASRSGKTYSTAEVRAFYAQGGNRYHCYLPGTRVSGRFVAGVKSRYKGPSVTLVTAGGRHLSVTPNHPVMANGGLVPAAEIKVGDHLIAYGPEVKDAFGVVDLNRELVGSRIEDVFGSLVESGHERVARVGRIDFHGDAAFMDEEIHVVEADRVLVVAVDAPCAQLLNHLSLIHPDTTAPARRAGELFLGAVCASPGGCVGAQDALQFDGRRQLVVSELLGFTSAARGKPAVLEPPEQDSPVETGAQTDREQRLAGQVVGMQEPCALCRPLPPPVLQPEAMPVKSLHERATTDADAARQIVDSFAGLAALDEVVEVVRGEFDGHVYDLQELSGLMLGSGIVASNCYCAQTECLLDEEGRPILTKQAQSALANERKTWQSRYGSPS